MNNIDPSKRESLEQNERPTAKLPSEIAGRFIDQDLANLEEHALDASKPLSEQKEAVYELEFTLERCLTPLFAGLKEGEKLNTESIRGLLKEPKAQKAYDEAIALVNTKDPEKVKWWETFLRRVETEASKKKKAVEDLEQGKVPEGTEWTGTALRWGLVAAGAVGAVMIYKWLRSDDEGYKKPLIGAALTLMGAGALAGPERLSRWAAKTGLELNSEAVSKFWESLKQGKFFDAMKAFNFNSQNPGVEFATKKLDISSAVVINVKDQRVEEYLSLQAEAARKGKNLLAATAEKIGGAGWAKWVPGMELDPEVLEDETKLSVYLNREKSRVEGHQNMTVMELLNALSKLEDPAVENVDKPAESGEGPLPDSLENHAQRFPSVREVMSDPNLSWHDKVFALVGASQSDGASLVVKDGSLFVVGVTEVAYLGSGAILGETLHEIYEVMSGGGSALDLGWTVMENGASWLMSPPGAAIATFGTAKALLNGKGITSAAFKGALSSIKTSYTLVPNTAYYITRWGTKGLELFRTFRSTAGGVLNSIDNPALAEWTRAQYHIDQYRAYFQHLEDLQSRNYLTKGKAKFMEWLTPDFSREMLKKHGTGFYEMAKAYGERLGINVDLPISKDQMAEGTPDSNRKMLKAMDEFISKHPTTSVPKITGSVKSHLEADGLGLRRLSDVQKTRLTTLGFTEAEQAAMRELNMSDAEFDDVLKELEKPGETGANLRKALRSSRGRKTFNDLKKAKVMGTSFSVLKGLGVVALLLTAYQYADSEDHANASAEILAGTAGAVGTLAALRSGFSLAGRSGIKNPWAMAGITVAGALGGTKLWDSTGRPYLEKHYPNREEYFSSNTALGQVLGILTLGNVFSSAQYMDARMSESGWAPWDSHVVTIDDTTDPIDYLSEKSDLILWGESTLRSQELLEQQSAKSVEYYKSLRAEEKDETKLAALDATIARLEQMADPSKPWVEPALAERIIQMQTLYIPISEAFARKASAKYGGAGTEAYTKLMEKVFDGVKHVDEGHEMELWNYLADTSIQTEAGEDVPFLDFVTMAAKRVQEIKFLTQLKAEKDGEKQNPKAEGDKILTA